MELPDHLSIHRWLMSKIEHSPTSVKPKEKYRLTNWPAYNTGLKQRGSLTLWLSEDMAQQWYHQGQRRKGGQLVYATDAESDV